MNVQLGAFLSEPLRFLTSPNRPFAGGGREVEHTIQEDTMYEQHFHQNGDEDGIGTAHELPDAFRTRFPNLTVAIGGRRGSKKEKTPAFSPASLILFARDGGIGFVISPRDSTVNAHGFVREPDDLLAQIEEQVDQGNIGWKPQSKRRS
jgi:hypothetical protein